MVSLWQRMNYCSECKIELPSNSRYCLNCGNQIGMKRDVYKVSADNLIGRVKNMVQDANVRKIIVKDDKGEVLISIPVTWGTAGVVATVALAPWLAALGVIAGVVTKCTIEVEKTKWLYLISERLIDFIFLRNGYILSKIFYMYNR